MNRKTLLLGALTLCLTTVSLASDKKKLDFDNESDDDWEIWEDPQEKKEDQKLSSVIKNAASSDKTGDGEQQDWEVLDDPTWSKGVNPRNKEKKKKLLGKKGRTRKRKRGFTAPKATLTTISDGTESGSTKSPLSSKKEKKPNSLDEYLARKKTKASYNDNGGHATEAGSSISYISGAGGALSSFSAPCSRENENQGNNNKKGQERLLPLVGKPFAPNEGFSPHLRQQKISLRDILAFICCQKF